MHHVSFMKSLLLILSKLRYFAPAWVFASLNIMTGTWVLYLPHVKSKFSLNDAEVGGALFCFAIGIVIAITLAPMVNRLLGVGRTTTYAVLLFALLFNLPILAPSYVLLCVGLLIVGMFSGFTDISMNALVSTIEHRDKAHFMSAAHGFFSLGGVIGAGLGMFVFSLYANTSWLMFGVSILVIVSNVLLAKYYYKETEVTIATEDKKGNWASFKLLIGLSLVAFIILCNEGAVEHWSNIYLSEMLHLDASKAGLGFITFSVTMTIGRFLADRISERIGSIPIILSGCIIAVLGYILILTATLIPTIIGFGILGLGLSVITPEIFRLAGQTKGIQPSTGISFVSGVGFVGFLIGPVIIGLIANNYGLSSSYLFLLGSVIFAVVMLGIHLRRGRI